MKNKKIFYFGLFLTTILVLSLVVFTSSANAVNVGEDVGSQLSAAGADQGANVGTYTDPRLIVANIIRVVLGFIGTIFFALTVYAGFLWMTAGGNDDKIEKSKSLLYQAVIGLIIILSAYSITSLAIRMALGQATFGAGSGIFDMSTQRGKICGPGTSVSCE